MSRGQRMVKNNTSTNNAKHPGMGPKPMAKPKDIKKSLGRLLKYVTSFKKIFILIIVVITIYTLVGLSQHVFLEQVIKSFGNYNPDTQRWIANPDYNLFVKGLILWAISHLGYAMLRYFSELLSAHLSNKIIRNMRKQAFSKLVKLPIAYTDTHKHGDIMSRTINDVDTCSSAISSTIGNLIGGILQIFGALLLMIWYSPLLTLVALAVLGLTIFVVTFISKVMAPLQSKQFELLGKLNSDAEEMISGSKTVIAYNRQEEAKRQFAEKSDLMSKIGIKAQIIGGSMGPMMNFVGNFGYFLICVLGGVFVINGIGSSLTGKPLDVPTIIVFLNLIKQFNRPINEIAQTFSELVAAFTASDRVFELFDEKEEDYSGKLSFTKDDIKGIIDFNHIQFSYVPEKPVLKDFNVEIYSGHKIALVGATGSGKTTIVNLLLRFYDINSGKITIDGIDIADIAKKDLRDCISIVLQDPILFKDSVENNIKYGRDDATDEDVDKALELANCLSFVNLLPEGKKTILNEGATNISQGQRQLLTIARAVIADPKILILDEATSSVDTRTEKKIQDAMVRLMENRTSIIIAHRLSTIQDADLIIVLDGGEIVEMGNHRELLEKKGVYNRLYQSQFAGNEI